MRATAGKVVKLLRGLETYVAGQAELIIDCAAARHDAEPISTAPTESAVQWLLHRRMGARQQMRLSLGERADHAPTRHEGRRGLQRRR
jgi:hypothetical protein